MLDALQVTQYIAYFVVMILGIGIQWGLYQGWKVTIQREIDILRKEHGNEIHELKKRTDKIPELITSQAEIKALLSESRLTINGNFDRIFRKLDDFDSDIKGFYKEYSRSLNNGNSS